MSDSIYITQYRKGWMNNELLLIWAKKILVPWIKTNRLGKVKLILDKAPAHVKAFNDVSKLLNDEILFIPEGCTYLLQPIDICIGKPYKDLVRVEFDNWFNLNYNKLTFKGNLVSPKPTDIIKWLESANKKFKSEVIVNSFKIGGFTIDLCNKIDLINLNKKLLNRDSIREFLDKLEEDDKYEEINDALELYNNLWEDAEIDFLRDDENINDDNFHSSFSESSKEHDVFNVESEEGIDSDQENLDKIHDEMIFLENSNQLIIQSFFKKNNSFAYNIIVLTKS